MHVTYCFVIPSQRVVMVSGRIKTLDICIKKNIKHINNRGRPRRGFGTRGKIVKNARVVHGAE